jgi:hypothetical protein
MCVCVCFLSLLVKFYIVDSVPCAKLRHRSPFANANHAASAGHRAVDALGRTRLKDAGEQWEWDDVPISVMQGSTHSALFFF